MRQRITAKEDKGCTMANTCFDFSKTNLQFSAVEVHIKMWKHVISGKLAKGQETNGIMKRNFFKLESTHQQSCGYIGLCILGFAA